MPHVSERIEFAPPRQGGTLRALTLAMIAHLFLVAALTWGVNWKSSSDSSAGMEAELWSSVPQVAAPREVLPPPTPPAPAAPPEQVKPPPPAPREADIAIEQEKKRRELEKKRELEQEELLEKQKQAKLEQEKRDQLEKDKKLQATQAALDKKLKEAEARKKQEADEAADRQRNLDRMAGLAGASGAPGATGNAQQSSGPSSGYGGRVKARVKPNIVFTDEVAGNPATEIEVRTSPDGTIISSRVTKSSGVPAWDQAVLRALEKTEVMPKDVDGRVPSPLIITFRPKEML